MALRMSAFRFATVLLCGAMSAGSAGCFETGGDPQAGRIIEMSGTGGSYEPDSGADRSIDAAREASATMDAPVEETAQVLPP
jgi:hypothetical protein